MKMLRGIDGIGMVEFDNRDIIRHRLVKYIIEAFDQQAKVLEPELFSDETATPNANDQPKYNDATDTASAANDTKGMSSTGTMSLSTPGNTAATKSNTRTVTKKKTKGQP